MSFYVLKALNRLGVETDIVPWPKVSYVLEGVTLRNRLRQRWSSLRFVKQRQLHAVEQQLLEKFEAFKPDVMLVLKGDGMPASLFQKIRTKYPVMIVNWYPDHIQNIHSNQFFETLDTFDRFFAKDPYMCAQLRKVGYTQIACLPEAFDPEAYYPMTPTDEAFEQYKSDVLMMGTYYPYRAQVARHLLDYDLKIWGSGWNMLGAGEDVLKAKWQGRPALDQERATALASTQILINTQYFAEVLGLNRRTYEAAGSRCFQITGKTSLLPQRDGLAYGFTPDSEIVCFEDIPDLRRKLDYYLIHTAEREEIAQNAYQRACTEHTYDIRMREMLDAIEGKPTKWDAL
ncbi:MAG: glycosyltransferase [Caldilineaceae bacterium]